jgi:hypothetical protein
MKIEKLIAKSAIILLAALSAQAQGTFQDLNFEQANPVAVGNPYPAYYVTAASALPGWTVYIGTVQQTDVLQNFSTTGAVAVEIFGPNLPATSSQPGSLDGNYSAFLEGGFGNPSGTLYSASIAQTGMVPVGSQSMQFEVWQSLPYNSAVSFNGNNLTPVVLGTTATYTIYGVDMAPYAGQTGQLEFTSTAPIGPGLTQFGVDDIAFSTNSVVPEPNILVLSAIGGLLFGVRKWFARRR